MIEWISDVLCEFEKDESDVLSDPRYIHKRFDDILSRLKKTEQKLDDQTMRRFKAGLRHLVDGQNSDVAEVRDDEFRMARSKFNEFLNLDPNGTTATSTGTTPNVLIVALSYWGNHHYFLLRGDKRNALIQVYEATALLPPPLGLQLYSPRFFSKNYFTSLTNALRGLEVASHHLDLANSKNSSATFVYSLKQIGLHLGAATIGLGPQSAC
jgi:hypothetical protein